jgi:hypothetical protein
MSADFNKPGVKKLWFLTGKNVFLIWEMEKYLGMAVQKVSWTHLISKTNFRIASFYVYFFISPFCTA